MVPVIWDRKREIALRFSAKALVTVRVRKLISATWWSNRPSAFCSRPDDSTGNYLSLTMWGHRVLCIAHRWTFCRAPSGWVQCLQTERGLPCPPWWNLWGRTKSHQQHICISHAQYDLFQPPFLFCILIHLPLRDQKCFALSSRPHRMCLIITDWDEQIWSK